MLSLSVNPGAKVFTQMPIGPSSRENARVIARIAPLETM